MDTQVLLDKLKRKFNLSSNEELAEQTGIALSSIKTWQNRGELSETIVANLIHKAVQTGGEIALKNGIVPIVEFYPINRTPSKQGAKWEILSGFQENEDEYEMEIKNELLENHGIYLFYSSTGHVIYAGKAKDQTLWKEMKDVFNRDRIAQTAYLVDHSKDGNIKERQVRLHEIAHYFSAYCVTDALINNLEAFLIRALPNDLTNTRMEKIKPWG